MTNSVSFAFLPSSALNWPRWRRAVRLVLDDEPGQISAPSPSVRWLTELTSAAPLPVWRSTIVAFAPAPTRTGKRDMRLAAGLHVLQLDRRGELRASGDVDEIAVGDEGGVERADRVVAVARAERRREAAIGQLVR